MPWADRRGLYSVYIGYIYTRYWGSWVRLSIGLGFSVSDAHTHMPTDGLAIWGSVAHAAVCSVDWNGRSIGRSAWLGARPCRGARVPVVMQRVLVDCQTPAIRALRRGLDTSSVWGTDICTVSLGSFEYFCQMSSKSIVIISSYTVSKLMRFWDTV